MKKIIISLLLLTLAACASKPILVKECQQVKEMGGVFVCKKL